MRPGRTKEPTVTGTSTARALVLGGGGVAGIAWETGVLAGLADEGVDVLDAGVIIGTSAGATVAAQVTSGRPLSELLAAQRDPDPGLEPQLDLDFEQLVADMGEAMTSSDDQRVALQRVGQLALRSDRVSEPERLKIIEARLPSTQWPEQLIRLTAVDTETGELELFDRTSGVSLVDAVAASCAVPVVWPAVTINGRRYMDGGIRSATNADVVAGHERVLVLMPLTVPDAPDVLPEGSETLVVAADEASTAAIGENPMDPRVRAACADAGYEQGVRMAAEIGAFWRAAVTSG
jgi:NTE family protein